MPDHARSGCGCGRGGPPRWTSRAGAGGVLVLSRRGSSPRRPGGRLPTARQSSATRSAALEAAPAIDREFAKLGYDSESRVPSSDRLWFIERKGRDAGAETVTVTRDEVYY